MTVREQLIALLQLQSTDVKVRELETAAAQLPTRLDPLRRDLTKLQGMLDVEKAKLAETESWRKEQAVTIERETDALKSAKTKLQASKNSKEFNAASREVENKRKSIGDREVELKKMVEASTTSSTQLESRDKDVGSLRGQLTESEAAINEQLAVIQAELDAARAIRDGARAQVDKPWLKTYDSLVTKRGYAVAPVIKGVCQGCHMALPPQLSNILARLESIETCPRCGRLVYRKELLDPTPAEQAATASEPPAPES